MKKLILKIIILLVTLGVVYEGYGMIKELNSSNKVLEDVREVDLKNNNSIAIMVQDTNTEEWHEADNRDSWPSPTTHGFVGAECTDSDGATLEWENVLTFDLTKQIATIKTKQTAYCTLYFAKGEPALDWLKKKGGTTFAGSNHTTIIDGMYRFVGTKDTVTNNYICFGTSVESECLKTPETYMYRIMGITSEADTTIGLKANQLKLIKATPSSTNQKWNNNDYSSWDNSLVKTYLNTTFYNATFVTETTKIPNASYWENIISNHKWYIKIQTSIGTTEPKDANYISTESKIGLMYASDYYNSGVQNTSNWLFILNGYTGNPTNIDEWTMSWSGYETNNNYSLPWLVDNNNPYVTDGTLWHDHDDNVKIVRPVFYLQSGVNLTGEGTKEHPYLIATMNNA